MNIAQPIISKGKLALKAHWSDTVTVSRVDGNSNIVDEFIVVCKDVPCHLSKNSLPTQNQPSTAAGTTTAFTLFVGADTEIRQGDTLVITHKNQQFAGVAGLPFAGSFSLTVPIEVVKIS